MNNLNCFNLNGKKFKSVSSTSNGEVSADTIFEYRQNEEIIWATYYGGEILFGTLSGRVEEGKLLFTYQHQNLKGDFKTGICETIVTSENNRLVLNEKWEWTCDDLSNGTSRLVEIKQLF